MTSAVMLDKLIRALCSVVRLRSAAEGPQPHEGHTNCHHEKLSQSVGREQCGISHLRLVPLGVVVEKRREEYQREHLD